MRSVIVGFSRPVKKKFLSSLIQWVEGTNFSHVYVRLRSEKYSRQLIYQASGLAVNFEGTVRFEKAAQIVHEFEFEITDEAYVTMMQWCIDYAGAPYSVKQLLGIAWLKLLRWINPRTMAKNPWSDGVEAFVCSELVGVLLRDRLGLGIQEDLDIAGPRDLYQYVSSLPDARRTYPPPATPQQSPL